jgi:hypothetical protein
MFSELRASRSIAEGAAETARFCEVNAFASIDCCLWAEAALREVAVVAFSWEFWLLGPTG